MESSHQNKILHWCRNVLVYHVLNFVNANSSQILKGPKPGTPHVINVHGFTLNKIYQKQKQKQKQDLRNKCSLLGIVMGITVESQTVVALVNVSKYSLE